VPFDVIRHTELARLLQQAPLSFQGVTREAVAQTTLHDRVVAQGLGAKLPDHSP